MLHHSDRTGEVDVDLAGDICERTILVQLDDAHDAGIVHQGIKFWKRMVTVSCSVRMLSASLTSLGKT